MSLNIKNERVHALAREAARRTGKTQTSVIEEALRRLLAEWDDEPTDAEVDRRWAKLKVRIAASNQAWRALPDDQRVEFSEEDLYDPETGLPV
jgi:antitoxin VapB